MEALINNLQFFNILKLTKSKQTLLFMTCSSILMNLIEQFPAELPKVNFWYVHFHEFHSFYGIF